MSALVCTDRTDCMADVHALCCPSAQRRWDAEGMSDRAADAILGLVEADRQLREHEPEPQGDQA